MWTEKKELQASKCYATKGRKGKKKYFQSMHSESVMTVRGKMKTTKNNVNWNMLGHEIFILHHKKRCWAVRRQKRMNSFPGENFLTLSSTSQLSCVFLFSIYFTFFFWSTLGLGDKLNKVKLFHSRSPWMVFVTCLNKSQRELSLSFFYSHSFFPFSLLSWENINHL